MTAVTYARNEIISTSELQKSLKNILDLLVNRKRKKVAISRNNQIEAVIVPVEIFEQSKNLEEAFALHEAYGNWEDVLEHIEIRQEIIPHKNKLKNRNGYITLEKLKEKLKNE